MADATFVCVAYYVASKRGKTGLADTTFDIDQIDPATSAMTTYLTAQAGTEVRNGIYRRFFTGDDAMMYEFVAKTADATVDQQWLAGVAVLLNRLERLDEDVSAEKTLTSAYAAAKTASQAGDAMALTSAERTTLAGVFWNVLTSALTTVGSIGKYIVDYLSGIKAKTDLLGTTTVAVVSPVRENGDVEITAGDCYLAVDGRRLTWTVETWDIAESSSVVVIIYRAVALAATRISAQSVGLELTTAQSAALPEGDRDFWIQEIKADGSGPITHQTGMWTTNKQPTPVAE